MNKENLHFDDRCKQVVFLFSSSRYFLKEIENMFSVFLSGYRNTRESLGEFEPFFSTFCINAFNKHSKTKLETTVSTKVRLSCACCL